MMRNTGPGNRATFREFIGFVLIFALVVLASGLNNN